MVSLSEDPMHRLRDAIEELIRIHPENWPEKLAAQAGAVCLMDVGALNLLADAATQIAAMAHRMKLEAENDNPWQEPDAN